MKPIGTFLGKTFEEKADDLDLDSLVKEGHVPTYIMATSNDNYVPSQNALAYAKALSDHHVFYFLHMYPNGEHGFGTADFEDAPYPSYTKNRYNVSSWIDECADFFRSFCSEPF